MDIFCPYCDFEQDIDGYEEDVNHEYKVFDAFRVFYITLPSYGELFEEWTIGTSSLNWSLITRKAILKDQGPIIIKKILQIL